MALPIPKDLHLMFRVAEAFLTVAQAARRDLGDGHPDELNYPLAVNHALSLEIYLKCLVYLEGKTLDREHGLKTLFEMLDNSTQERAEQYYEQFRINSPYCQAMEAELRRLGRDPAVEYEFKAALAKGSDAFVKMRYAYEGELGRNYLLMPLELGIRRIILERNPSWDPEAVSLKSLLGIPPTSPPR
jgi:HEPN domain-containing protein